MELLGIDRPSPPLADLVFQRLETLVPRHVEQLNARAGAARFRLHELPSLGQRQGAGFHSRFHRRLLIQRRRGFERRFGRTGRAARRPGQPVGHIGETSFPMHARLAGPNRRPNPRCGTGLLGGCKFLHENGAVLRRNGLRAEGDERDP